MLNLPQIYTYVCMCTYTYCKEGSNMRHHLNVYFKFFLETFIFRITDTFLEVNIGRFTQEQFFFFYKTWNSDS